MDPKLEVQPLSQSHRKGTFLILFVLFVVSLPFLYFYATGYRIDLGSGQNIVSTGGMYIGAERGGSEIYIDDELVRETRAFRRAFYAQSLMPGTHRVHVQKAEHHTWVKELPVSPHLVTEAQAFNMPLIPQIRVIAPWQSATGSAVVATTSLFSEPITTINELLATSSVATTTFIENTEYATLLRLFATTSATTTETFAEQLVEQIDVFLQATTTATTTEEHATTTKESRGVRLYESMESIYAMWVGAEEDMPYYYCAEDFPPYSTTSRELFIPTPPDEEQSANTAELIHPVQTVSEDTECEPAIQIHTQFQSVSSFDFYPGSTDLVILALDDGVYVIEIDNRAWQNIQPLLLGTNLDMRVLNGQVYVYDGELIYQVMLET